jgi:uncharacterized membrane protein YdjX (TVP38/TMEM64 family)
MSARSKTQNIARSASSTRSAIFRAVILVAILAAAFAAARWTPLGDWLQRDLIVGRLIAYRENAWSGPLLVGLYTVFGLFGLPVSPLMFAGAAVFGAFGGWIVNMVGCILGSAVSFGAGQWLGGDLIRRLVGEKRFAAMMTIWDRHGFWTVFRLRFVPIPFPFVNYGAALAGIRFGTYLLASTLGMAVSVAVWTYLFHTLFEATTGEQSGLIVKAVLALAGALILTFLPALLRRRASGGEAS